MNVTLRTELDIRAAATQPKQRLFLPTRTRWELINPFKLTLGYYTALNEYVVEDFTVPVGFEFDAASIPFFLWWRFQPTYQPSFKASCFHDYVYEKLYEYYSKEFADAAFKAIMLEDGAPAHVAFIFHAGVSVFGKGGW